MMKFELNFVALALMVATVVGSDSHGLNLRRKSEQSHRRLVHPHHDSSGGSGGSSGSGGSGSDYYGCLDLNSTEQDEAWSDGPSCGYGDDNSTSSSGNEDDTTVTEYEVVDDDTITNPYEDFVITQCDTYESLWRWDLHMSCGSDSSNLDTCNCTFAEELFDKGLLVCEDRERCPRSCPICSTCLSVLGCPETVGPSNRLATSTMIYIIVGAVILLVVALAVFHSRRRRQQQHELKQQLITEDECGADVAGCGDGARFEPPNVDAGNSSGNSAAMFAGGAAVGAWKASKETQSETDTDDCTRSIDATVPTIEDSSSTPFVAMAATGIATVRSEAEDAGPEDENEETRVIDTAEKENEVAEVDENRGMQIEESPAVADVGAVREAFLQSLETDGSIQDQETSTGTSIPAAADEERTEALSSTDASDELEKILGSPNAATAAEEKSIVGPDEISDNNISADKDSDIVAEENSHVEPTVDVENEDEPKNS